MALKIREITMPTTKYNIKCPYSMTPTRIVIHNTANDATAENEIKYMQSNNNQVSFHYAVDDNEAVLGIPLNRNAWHAGDGGNGIGNRQGIAIEICYSRSGGEKFIKAEQNAAILTAQLLKERGWGIDKVTKHQDYSGKYCLPLDVTELLTKDGWKPLGDIKVGDEVAQFDNEIISFAPVSYVIPTHMAEVIKARKVEATADHDMLYKFQKSSIWKKEKWGTLLDKHAVYLPVGGNYKDAPGLPVTDDFIRFLVWTQGDGHYAQRKSKYTDNINQLGIEFHFAKKSKVDRLICILESMDQKYSYHMRSDGTYSIRIHDSKIQDILEEYLDDKMFSWKMIEMDEHQRKIFLEEILYVDGSLENKSYFSTKQQNYDVVSAIAALSNQRCMQTTTGNSTALIMCDSRFCIVKDTEKERRETMVSCVTVPSGAILIRQYGQPRIVGNCPHRTLDMGWQRFLNMVNAQLQQNSSSVIAAKPQYKDDYEHDGLRFHRAKDFRIVYYDLNKKKYNADTYINGGFFAYFKENGVDFTLPVANLVCDINRSFVSEPTKKYLSPYIFGNKLYYGCNNNQTSQFKNKAVSTLVVPKTGKPYVSDLIAPPSDCLYAISGVPTVRDGDDVDYYNYVKKQGWDDSCMYATYRNWLGVRDGEIWVISGRTWRSNYIYGMEIWSKIKSEGFDDAICIDGGGSYYCKIDGKVQTTAGTRSVNNVITF